MDSRQSIRVMTYNVHSCIGMDGTLSPTRIAEVIALCDPDIVALQELEVGRARTGFVDQAQEVARHLKMDFHFHPAMQLAEEQFGEAILSRLPMRLVRAAALPTSLMKGLEKRGALWTAIRVAGVELQLINTHLGLNRWDRMVQTDALLGEHWLAHPACVPPLIVCGDFNARAGSRVHRRYLTRLRDVHRDVAVRSTTYPTRMPVLSIDHIFLSAELKVKHVEVPRTPLTRIASDHFPLIAELQLT